MSVSLVKSAESKLVAAIATQDLLADDSDEAALAEAERLLLELDREEQQDVDDVALMIEAGTLTTTAFDLLQKHVDDAKSRIVLPEHIRYRVTYFFDFFSYFISN